MRKDISLGHQNKINGAWIYLALEKAFELYGMDYDCLITTSKLVLEELRKKHFLDFIDIQTISKNIPFNLLPPSCRNLTATKRPSNFYQADYYNREILPQTEETSQIFTPYDRRINGYLGDLNDPNPHLANPQYRLCLAEILKWMGEVKHHHRVIKVDRINMDQGPHMWDDYRKMWNSSMNPSHTNTQNPPPHKLPETPRSSFLKEQYFRADGNVRELNKIYPHKSPAEIQKMIEDYNLKTGLWVLRETITQLANGTTKITHSFKKKQDNIKYYKDYLKIQLHLEISPSVDFRQKTRHVAKIKLVAGGGDVYYSHNFQRGFCGGIWGPRGIGDREAFITAVLNYYGREGIFKREGDNFMRVRDGQYLVRN